jgi:hypothetical protein
VSHVALLAVSLGTVLFGAGLWIGPNRDMEVREDESWTPRRVAAVVGLVVIGAGVVGAVVAVVLMMAG